MLKVTLCGSTKFKSEYEYWNRRLTLAGALVYSVAGYGNSGENYTMEEKALLDIIHLHKIAASDCIFVITGAPAIQETPYIGESTMREIIYCRGKKKAVYFSHDIATQGLEERIKSEAGLP